MKKYIPIIREETYRFYLAARATFRLLATDARFLTYYVVWALVLPIAILLVYWGNYLAFLSLAVGWAMALINIELMAYRDQAVKIMREIEKEDDDE